MKASRFPTAAFFLLLALLAVPALAIEPIDSFHEAASWVAGLERLPADFASFSRCIF